MARISAPVSDRRFSQLTWITRGIWVLVIALAAALVSLAFYHEQIAMYFLGPPEVEMREAYAGTGDQEARFDHVLLDQLLAEHVDENGLVDYRALRRDRRKLDAYLEMVAKADFDRLPRDGKLAMLINLYNAATLKLIVERAPAESIRQIPEEERWKDQRWRLGDRTLSLDQIEHDELRAKFIEPRIHFAIVCASRSCPPLRREAYRAAKIEEQLEAQSRRFHETIHGVVINQEKRVVRLSRLYLWYENDFAQASKVSNAEYASRYSAELAEILAGKDRWSFGWIDYDWALNSQAH
jgi:uncharacterized protein DUF547